MGSGGKNRKPMELARDYVYDPDGKLCCVVCKCYVPSEANSMGNHLKGKKHVKKRALVTEQVIESRRLLVMNKKTLDSRKQSTGWCVSRSKDELNEVELGKPGSLVHRFEQVMSLPPQEEHPMANDAMLIDKKTLVESVLLGQWKPTTASNAPAPSVDDVSAIDEELCLSKRTAGLSPLEYRRKDGMDTFFDSIAPETRAPRIARELGEIISSFRNAGGGNKDFGSPTSISPKSVGREEAHVSEVIGEEEDDGYAPWLLSPESREAVKVSQDHLLALHYEVIDFARFVSATSNERRLRQETVDTVRIIVEELWSGSQVVKFGSYATGLFLPSGDIDLTVIGTPKQGDESEVEMLAHAIRNVEGFARQLHVIKARVPLVQLVARNGNVKVDISFGHERGVHYVEKILGYLKTYPLLRPLLLVLKCFMEQHSLNSAFMGGLCSYGLLLLVVSHLQMYGVNFAGAERNLGCVLRNFFDFYGNKFNYCMVGVDLNNGGSYYVKIHRFDTDPNDMLRYSVTDPNDSANEVGRNGYKAVFIRRAFSLAARKLTTWQRDASSQHLSPLSAIINIDNGLRKRRKLVHDELIRKNSLDLASYVRHRNSN